MRVLVACEFSGVVREAFRKHGHDSWSCDLLETEIPGQHIVGDVLSILGNGWDLMIAHPPCTYICCAGRAWFKKRQTEQVAAIGFFMALANSPIPKKAIENPIGIMSTRFRKSDQIIHPPDFGHPCNKPTCLWLSGLPPLMATHCVQKIKGLIDKIPRDKNSKTRGLERSRTFQGIADAMASQWG